MNETYQDLPLPEGIRSRFVDNGNGLSMHVLEAGFQTPSRRCIVLLHGFPELAYSWRKIMLPLAQAGYHVIAPDQRGYGRTTGGDASFYTLLDAFAFPNLVRDVLGLLYAFGYRRVAAVIGHDFGSPVAAWCALIRPDVFESVVLMSAPFAGPPSFAFGAAADHEPLEPADTSSSAIAHAVTALASLDPPRKHINGITRAHRPTTTCCMPSKVFMRSCVRTITRKARTGRAIIRIRSRLYRPRNWLRCRRITSCAKIEPCRRRWLTFCRIHSKLRLAHGLAMTNSMCTQASSPAPDFKAA